MPGKRVAILPQEFIRMENESRNRPLISIVIPCYKCASSLVELHRRLTRTLGAIAPDYEIIFVNDRSPADDWEEIRRLAQTDAKVVGVNLSRNFGQQRAIFAGLTYSKGDWVVVMDGDLQDQPEEIRKLYDMAVTGYDQVVGRRVERKDGLLKRTCSKLFFRVFNYLAGTRIDGRIGNFGIYSRKVIDSVLQMHEQNVSLGLSAIWVGYKRIEIDIDHGARTRGKSSYTFDKLIDIAFSIIVANSNHLLKIIVKAGFLMSFCSFAFSLWFAVRYFLFKVPVVGWTSLIVSIYFLSGLLLLAIGVVGVYVDKIFDESKKRSLFIVDEVVSWENTK
jgi:dolichol-phosphate mannosyltransferase